MKKIFGIIGIFTLVLTGCSGEDGLDGQDGLDGDALVGQTVEYDVNYEYIDNSNLWTAILDYSDLEVLEGDAVLAYLQEQVPGDDGPINVWSQLPLTKFTDNGTVQYSFNHDTGTTELLIEGNYDLSNLSNDFVANRVARVVIVPSDIVAQFNGDFSNLKEVMGTLEINEGDIKRFE